jgi:hypothetical protein
MTTIEKITKQIQQLPEPSQQEVLDFVEFLLSRKHGDGRRQEELDWIEFSLTSAIRGMEDENDLTYDESDLKEKWQ